MGNMEMLLKADERAEDLQRKGLWFIKPSTGFQYGTDQVLLADFAHVRMRETICDLCAGSGILTLLLMGRGDGLRAEAVELDPMQADRLRRCVLLNGLEKSVCVRQGDIRMIRQLLPSGRFSLVICNPPYHGREAAERMPDAEKMARTEIACSFGDVCGAARWLLKNKGRLVTMCPSGRMAEMMQAMAESGLTPKRLRLVQAGIHKAPYLCLIEAMAGAKPGMKVEPVLLLSDEGGTPLDELRLIYGSEVDT